MHIGSYQPNILKFPNATGLESLGSQNSGVPDQRMALTQQHWSFASLRFISLVTELTVDQSFCE